MKDNSVRKVESSVLLKELQNRGYVAVKRALKSAGRSRNVSLQRWEGGKYTFGVVSDTHLGSRYQQLTHLKSFYALCMERGIRVMLHCGDLVDGEKMYRGQEYEIFVHGADRQIEYAVENYPRFPRMKTWIISGNHDNSFLKSAGIDAVKHVSRRREDFIYLGADFATLKFKRLLIALMHGTSGVPYARSYRIQKIVEQLASENKPNMLFLGHKMYVSVS